jgi:hypothetical protein
VQLGRGDALALSANGRWALAATLDLKGNPRHLVLYPTGEDKAHLDPVHLDRGKLEAINWGVWFPDGEHVLVCGAEAQHRRCYKQAINGGPPVPVTADGPERAWMRPDGNMVLGVDGAGWNSGGTAWRLYPLDGGAPQPVKGMGPDDRMAGWASNGQAIFVMHGIATPVTIERLDLATGRRDPMFTFDPPGADRVTSTSVSPDGRAYAYAYVSSPTTMFVVTGMKDR